MPRANPNCHHRLRQQGPTYFTFGNSIAEYRNQLARFMVFGSRTHIDSSNLELEPFGLYCVTYRDQSIHVLADSEAGARQQSTCKWGYDSDTEDMTAVRVPFMVRGCSGDEF